MPIFAYNDAGLANFETLLHDLYFSLPKPGLRCEEGTVCITFSDEERSLRSEAVSQFRLCIHDVEGVVIEGHPERCPRTLILNRLKHQKKEKLVTLHAVHPLRIVCKVKRLYLELEQIA